MIKECTELSDKDSSGLTSNRATTGTMAQTSVASSVRYCVITPTRDDEKFIATTIDAVVQQTILPVEWIIVDDGSKDRTGQIIDEYAKKYEWIRPIHREDRGYRSTGGGVEAFVDAYHLLKCSNWEFLVNLDGDLSFAPDYFEKCFANFRQMPRLGIAGGTIYNKVGDQLQLEKTAKFHVRGATKIYRRECWDEIGGLLRGLGWDTADEVTANMRGWTTLSFPELRLIHYRLTGTGWGTWGGAVKDGQADYLIGYHPAFFIVKCVRSIFKRPYLVRALGMAYGFSKNWLHRAPQVDKKLISYVRRQQTRRLLGLDSIWK
jgi:poly-beta-1,6-N-acetyl-D-glucosamine synthase